MTSRTSPTPAGSATSETETQEMRVVCRPRPACISAELGVIMNLKAAILCGYYPILFAAIRAWFKIHPAYGMHDFAAFAKANHLELFVFVSDDPLPAGAHYVPYGVDYTRRITCKAEVHIPRAGDELPSPEKLHMSPKKYNDLLSQVGAVQMPDTSVQTAIDGIRKFVIPGSLHDDGPSELMKKIIANEVVLGALCEDVVSD